MQTFQSILKSFLQSWEKAGQESIQWVHPKSQTKVTFDLGSYNPYKITIDIPDATPYIDNASILKSCLATLTGQKAEGILGFDDYDEINYSISIETHDPNWEAKTESHIPVPVTVTLAYSLIR